MACILKNTNKGGNTNFIENKTFIYFLTNKKYNLKSLSKLFLIESELNKSDNSIIYYVN